MINLPSQQELKELKTFNEPFCLTIYAPFIDPNAATNPNRIELKNLLREAETALLSAGVEPKRIKKTLKPARLLEENHEFWPMHHESLVLFMHPELFRYYHIPAHTTPLMLTVENGFNLEPLLKVIAGNKQYFVLALSHKDVHLYKGDRYHLKPLHLKDFPSDMKKTLNIDEYPNWRETHAIAPSYMGKGSEAVHGQYNVAQTDKAMLKEFFRHIDHRLHSYLSSQHRPLILAGVQYLLPIYRQVNTSPYLLDGDIKGNLANSSLDLIRERAWSLMNKGGP
jgi:hypothetical protein